MYISINVHVASFKSWMTQRFSWSWGQILLKPVIVYVLCGTFSNGLSSFWDQWTVIFVTKYVDVWKLKLHFWSFVRAIHQWPMGLSHKWTVMLSFRASLLLASKRCWINSRVDSILRGRYSTGKLMNIWLVEKDSNAFVLFYQHLLLRLGTQGARAPTARVLTYFFRDIQVPAPED